MHPHTKQQLYKFRKEFGRVEDTTGFYDEYSREEIFLSKEKQKISKFIQQALKSQAEMIRAEMVPDFCDNQNTPKEWLGGFNTCVSALRTELNKLINSFK